MTLAIYTYHTSQKAMMKGSEGLPAESLTPSVQNLFLIRLVTFENWGTSRKCKITSPPKLFQELSWSLSVVPF